jgi:hypothetical protein
VALNGEQTIDGVLTNASRVLVKDQTEPEENGIYLTSTGNWRRTKDFSRNDDVVAGTLVLVTGGSTNIGGWVTSFTGSLQIDTTEISFTDLAILVADLSDYAPLASPTFTGTPSGPTAAVGTNTTQLATTAFVKAAIDVVLGGVASAFDTLAEIATALGRALYSDVERQTITGGGNITPKDLGTLSAAGSNTVTPDPGDRGIQLVSNDHAGSILPGTAVGSYLLIVSNATGAGAITTTGWTVKGDSFDTTTTSVFVCACLVTSAVKLMTVTKYA